MATSNKERIGRALDSLLPEMRKYVEQELRDVYAEKWGQHVTPGEGQLDIQRLCNTILAEWDPVFDVVLSKDARNLVHEIRKWRNKHAHQEPFTFDDTVASLIDIQRFLEIIQSPVAEEVERSKMEVMRAHFVSGAK